jgi:hypothetical protein
MLTRMVITVVLATTGFASSAQADVYRHIDELALRLQQQAQELDREFTLHYRHASQYRHLRSDSREMVELAAHVHDVAHDCGPLTHLQSDLRQLDHLFHHIEDLVAEMEHDARRGDYHSRYGHYGHPGHWGGGYHGRGGHIHGDTRHVRRLMKAMEDTLHHLQEDVDELAAAQRAPRFGRAVPAPVVVPSYPPVPAFPANPGPTIRFSRPGFSIWLGR